MLSQVVVFLKLKWKIILINCAFIFSLIHAFDLDHQIGRKRFVVGFASGLTSFPALSQSQLLSKMDASFAGSFFEFNGKVAYKQLYVPIEDCSIKVPVSCWFPMTSSEGEQRHQAAPDYPYRISLQKIAKLLANWELPSFFVRSFRVIPSRPLVDGVDQPFPSNDLPVVLLAHGYLGSRFDLSHLAEMLGEQGFVCIAAEYPESLAASYEPCPGLDRRKINESLLKSLRNDWQIKAASFGIVGHSLGCSTALQIGDKSWARVLVSGFPRTPDGRFASSNFLLVTSTNDGVVSRFLRGVNAVPDDVAILNDNFFGQDKEAPIPRRSALIFEQPDGPNHISFLTEGVNDAMINFLSPLLPLARLFNIPVLDFDRYAISRDSVQTSAIVLPLILRYLVQEMVVKNDELQARY